MKRLIGFVIAICFTIFGQALASNESVPPSVTIMMASVFGMAFGALISFCYLGERMDYVQRIGVVGIMIVGGIVTMGPDGIAPLFLPAFGVCGCVGGFGTVMYTTNYSGDSDDDIDG